MQETTTEADGAKFLGRELSKLCSKEGFRVGVSLTYNWSEYAKKVEMASSSPDVSVRTADDILIRIWTKPREQ